MRSEREEARRCLEAIGLAPGASFDEVRVARRELVKLWHPDRFSADPALRDAGEERLKEINAAFTWLTRHQDLLWDLPRGAPGRSFSGAGLAALGAAALGVIVVVVSSGFQAAESRAARSVAAPPAVAAPPPGTIEPPWAPPARFVQLSGLNVRSAPGMASEVVSVLSEGDAVLVLRQFNGWVEIGFPLATASLGWVSLEYLSGEPPELLP